ncbi:MAG: glycogen/starch/alpha-glucan phosphorylase, partial [Pseudomonadota bacterium]
MSTHPTAKHDAALAAETLGMDADAILKDFRHYFSLTLGQFALEPGNPYACQALAYAVRDRLMERWSETHRKRVEADAKRTAYLSLEFLMGRLLGNALLNLDLEPAAREAMQRIGIALEDVEQAEHDAGLGNGGLGRLAACFLDSCATLGLPVIGYGIRYRYGMFHQQLRDGR